MTSEGGNKIVWQMSHDLKKSCIFAALIKMTTHMKEIFNIKHIKEIFNIKEIFKLIGETTKLLWAPFKRMIDILFTDEDSLISPEGREILSDPKKSEIFFKALKEADQERKQKGSVQLIRKELHFSDGSMTVLI